MEMSVKVENMGMIRKKNGLWSKQTISYTN